MAAISTKQREIIKGYLEGFIQGIVDEYKGRIIHKLTTGKEYLARSSLNGELKPFDEVVVIGDEFWNIVGGPTAYEELLEIYLEVGREKSKYMLDALAFGF